MYHTFDVSIACEFGINAAVILHHIAYWVVRNEAEGVNVHEGVGWTFDSRRAYREKFPYLGERQIDTAFSKLLSAGLITSGRFNKRAWDRTLWYTLTEEGRRRLDVSHSDVLSHSIATFCGNGDRRNVSLQGSEMQQPIPHNYSIETQFNLFWSAYPRKEGKKAALRAFSKLDSSVWPLLIPAVEKHKQRPQWQNRQYIPLPATWLNGERWEDEVDDAVEPEAEERVPDGFQLVEVAGGRKEWRRCSETT